MAYPSRSPFLPAKPVQSITAATSRQSTGLRLSRRLLLCLGPSPGPRSERPAGGSVTYDQHDTPYLDAALRYRDDRLHAVPHSRTQVREGRPGRSARAARRRLSARRRRHGRRRRGHARVDPAHPPRRRLRRRGLGRGSHLVPRQRLEQRHPRPDAHALRTRRHGHHPPQRPQVDARRTHLHRRRARVHGTGDRPCLGDPAQRDRRAGATRAGRPPRRQGAGRHLADLQRPRRRSCRHRRGWPTRPACRSSPTRPGARTCASAACFPSTP